MHHSLVSWEITLQYFFSWKFIWFGQKEPIKVQNFRLSAGHVKFHQIWTLISPFCRKYIKFQLKKSIEELCLMTLKNDAKFEKETDLLFQKWQECLDLDRITISVHKCRSSDLLCKIIMDIQTNGNLNYNPQSGQPNSNDAIFRCSYRSCSIKKVFVKFCKIHKKTLYRSLFYKVASLRKFSAKNWRN